MPDPKTRRPDGFVETSINLEDNASVVSSTLADQSTATHGAARFAVSVVAVLNNLPSAAGGVSIERREVKGKPHHGNLLFGAIPPRTVKTVAMALATESELIRRAPPESAPPKSAPPESAPPDAS